MSKTKRTYKAGDQYLFDGIPHVVRHANAGKAWLAPAFGDDRHVASVRLNEYGICEVTGRGAAKVVPERCVDCQKPLKDGQSIVRNDHGKGWHQACVFRSEAYYEEQGR